MAQERQPVRAEGEAPAPAAAPKTPMFSPAGLVVLLVVSILVMGATYMVTVLVRGQGGGGGLGIEAGHYVDLGNFTTTLAVAGGPAQRFSVHLYLEINPKRGDAEKVRSKVDKMEPKLRDRVNRYFSNCPLEELRNRAHLPRHREAILQIVNQELPSGEDDVAVVSEVLFYSVETPAQ